MSKLKTIDTIGATSCQNRHRGQSLFVTVKGANQFNQLELFYRERCLLDYINSTNIYGKVVFCITPGGFYSPAYFAEIASLVEKNGGKGFIFSQHNTDSITLWGIRTTFIPCVAVDFEIANQIYQYYINSDIPKAKISLTQTTIGNEVPAPKIAAFSSRGPSPLFPGVLKPDIAAPGVAILAAVPQTAAFKSLGLFYQFGSGTSMSCPHVSGIVALLKALHPDWSPAALKSALMTTALTTDNNGLLLQADGTPTKIADPFDYGAGFVNPSKAADPGLIYDIDPADYLKLFNCMGVFGVNGNCTPPRASLSDLNLPSIVIPGLKTSETVMRTVTNVGQPDAVYKAFLQAPAGVEMSVEPSAMVFSKDTRVQSFKVNFKATRKIQGDYSFGSLAWHDGGDHWVRIPIAVRIIVEEFYSSVS